MLAENGLSSKEKARQKGQKLLFDAVKHLTTLSTGSILLLIALLEKLFTDKDKLEWAFLIAVCIISLMASTICSLLTMFVLSNSVFYLREKVELGSKKGAYVFYFSLFFFCVGVISVVAFALKNFY